ncbi:MAG: hypothetical protein V4735_08865 [Pseudomonadota bacterium]
MSTNSAKPIIVVINGDDTNRSEVYTQQMLDAAFENQGYVPNKDYHTIGTNDKGTSLAEINTRLKEIAAQHPGQPISFFLNAHGMVNIIGLNPSSKDDPVITSPQDFFKTIAPYSTPGSSVYIVSCFGGSFLDEANRYLPEGTQVVAMAKSYESNVFNNSGNLFSYLSRERIDRPLNAREMVNLSLLRNTGSPNEPVSLITSKAAPAYFDYESGLKQTIENRQAWLANTTLDKIPSIKPYIDESEFALMKQKLLDAKGSNGEILAALFEDKAVPYNKMLLLARGVSEAHGVSSNMTSQEAERQEMFAALSPAVLGEEMFGFFATDQDRADGKDYNAILKNGGDFEAFISGKLNATGRLGMEKLAQVVASGNTNALQYVLDHKLASIDNIMLVSAALKNKELISWSVAHGGNLNAALERVPNPVEVLQALGGGLNRKDASGITPYDMLAKAAGKDGYDTAEETFIKELQQTPPADINSVAYHYTGPTAKPETLDRLFSLGAKAKYIAPNGRDFLQSAVIPDNNKGVYTPNDAIFSKLVFDKKLDVNRILELKDDYGTSKNTTLFNYAWAHAGDKGNIQDIAKYLPLYTAKNEIDTVGNTMAYYAAQNPKISMQLLDTLNSRGVSLTAANKRGENLLNGLAVSGNADVFFAAAEKYKLDIMNPSRSKKTALETLLEKADAASLEKGLSNVSDVTTASLIKNATLQKALIGGDLALAERMLQAGADTTARDKMGGTPISNALQQYAKMSARDFEADMRTTMRMSEEDRRAFYEKKRKDAEAAKTTMTAFLKSHVDQLGDVNARLGGFSMLDKAALEKMNDKMRAMLEGDTLFQQTSRLNDADLYEAMVKRGADQSVKDAKGNPPYLGILSDSAQPEGTAARIVALIPEKDRGPETAMVLASLAVAQGNVTEFDRQASLLPQGARFDRSLGDLDWKKMGNTFPFSSEIDSFTYDKKNPADQVNAMTKRLVDYYSGDKEIMARMADYLTFRGRSGQAMRLQADTIIGQLGLDKVVETVSLEQPNFSPEWGNQLLKQPLTQDHKNRLLNAAIHTAASNEAMAIREEKGSKDPSDWVNFPKEKLPELMKDSGEKAREAREQLPAYYTFIKSIVQAGANPTAIVENASGIKRLLMPTMSSDKSLNDAQQAIFKSLLTMGLDLQHPEVHDAITNYGDTQMRALLSSRRPSDKPTVRQAENSQADPGALLSAPQTKVGPLAINSGVSIQ